MSTVDSFFFNDPATTEIYTLSLHDALPISTRQTCTASPRVSALLSWPTWRPTCSNSISQSPAHRSGCRLTRSEEHTSELQSQSNLVCRLLLEKKKNNNDTSTAMVHRHTQAC